MGAEPGLPGRGGIVGADRLALVVTPQRFVGLVEFEVGAGRVSLNRLIG
jgi:hypothetical protein